MTASDGSNSSCICGHTGNYTREEAIAAIDNERTLPDVLSFDPSKPAKYPNGRVFTDDVIDYRLAFLTKNQCPPSGLKPHTDTLNEFPYIGTPHAKALAAGSCVRFRGVAAQFPWREHDVRRSCLRVVSCRQQRSRRGAKLKEVGR